MEKLPLALRPETEDTDKRLLSEPCGTAMLFLGLLFGTSKGTLPLPVPEATLALLLLLVALSLASNAANVVAAAALAMLLFVLAVALLPAV